MSEEGKLVLVTGASGYIAVHIIKQLQEAGYRVRGTVRNLKDDVKCNPIRKLCPNAAYPVELVEADLMRDEGWTEAVKDCDYVLHTASPLPSAPPSDENEIIRPAVDGTLRVLRAIRECKTVKRCVITSSLAAIYGLRDLELYTEENWTDPEKPGAIAYNKSKTLAEKAAWDFMKDKENFELAVINPSVVVGPVLCGGDATVVTFVKKILNREFPMLPNYYDGLVDIRDVARAHIVAMTLPEAAGNRFLLSTQTMWFKDIATILKEEFQGQGYSISTSVAPNWLMWIMSFFTKEVALLYPVLGKSFGLDNTKMRKILGIEPIDVRKSLVDMAYSMIERGIVAKTDKYKGPSQDTES